VPMKMLIGSKRSGIEGDVVKSDSAIVVDLAASQHVIVEWRAGRGLAGARR